MDEQRLIELETKIAHQEHLIGILNATATRQELEIHNLRESMAALAKRMKETMDLGAPPPANEKPPHY